MEALKRALAEHSLRARLGAGMSAWNNRYEGRQEGTTLVTGETSGLKALAAFIAPFARLCDLPQVSDSHVIHSYSLGPYFPI